MEKQEKIQLKNNPVLSWDGLGVEHDEQKLKEKLNGILGQVHFRRVMWPK